jgi:bifunctional UDP-N-acetylglucosamine pyrophosphorylase/glucosamine-1-phosphate N-acetyltransferase
VARIVEVKDASPDVLEIREVNLGNYVARSEFLWDALARIGNDNAKGEYYLTDLVAIALQDGRRVETARVEDWEEALGINDRADLARAEAVLRRRIAQHWMVEGVTLVDPERSYIDADVEIGADSVIEPGVTLRGPTRIGAGCRVSAGSVVDGSTLGAGTWIRPQCWIEDSRVGDDCAIGPSAHLRPGNEIGDRVRIGNFVEVKNSRIGDGTKADHLSYIGDADVGAGVTFACGAITVNYDGIAKHRSTIGDGVFVGCNANLIAPITIQAGAFIAAGSTISNDVPAGALSVARARQREIEGWVERRRKRAKKD